MFDEEILRLFSTLEKSWIALAISIATGNGKDQRLSILRLTKPAKQM